MSKIPEIIYHYTTSRVVRSILENKAIWASDIRYMNDADELLFAKNAARERIADKLKSMPSPNPVADPQHSTLNSVVSEIDKLKTDKYSYQRVYAACFCTNGDLLSQWRAYAGNDGYAIGFRTEILKQISNPMGNDLPIVLKEVRYGIEDSQDILDDMMESIAQSPTGHPGAQGYAKFGKEVLMRLAVIKNPAFMEEQEWRLIAAGQGTQELYFRDSNLGLVPYIKFELPKNAIAEIRLGPGSNRELRGEAIRQLISKCEPSSQVSISFSESPLRS
jgi:hypothetical protein